MERKITDIYTQYKIPPNLQRHMIWVASVAFLICDNFNEPLPKEEIVSACLLHDMGNIIKYDMSYFPELLEPEGLNYWQKVKDEYIAKYGENEHKATIKIAGELGISPRIISWVSEELFSLLCKHSISDDFNMKIIHYADMRVGPYGILSYDERMDEAKKRYKDKKYLPGEEELAKLVGCGKELEKQIFVKCKIKPEDINDETAKVVISELKNFVIPG